MGYIDLIPDVFRLTMPDLATGKSYHTQKFNVGNKQCIGVTVKASQALSIAVAYGIATDTAASAGVDQSPSLPYKTSATTFASNNSTEGGTYHELAIPPHARQAQLVISNASGSTVSGAVIDAALRVVAYPAASGSGSSDFASITGWPGSSSQFVHADGSYSPLSAADIPGADTADAGQVPTSDGAGGFTWEDQAGGGAPSGTGFAHVTGGVWDTPAALLASDIPSLAASKITSGQLALAQGGTNADLSATGGTGRVLKQKTAGGAIAVEALVANDIPNALNATSFNGIIAAGANLVRGAGFTNGVSNSSQTRYAGGFSNGTVYPEICINGPTYAGSSGGGPGTVGIKNSGTARASNGTWTQVYALADGEHHGSIYVNDNLGDGEARYPINGTTLGTVEDKASGITYVDAGSVGASNVGLRTNSGWVEINVGTSIAAATKFGLRFVGMVV